LVVTLGGVAFLFGGVGQYSRDCNLVDMRPKRYQQEREKRKNKRKKNKEEKNRASKAARENYFDISLLIVLVGMIIYASREHLGLQSHVFCPFQNISHLASDPMSTISLASFRILPH